MHFFNTHEGTQRLLQRLITCKNVYFFDPTSIPFPYFRGVNSYDIYILFDKMNFFRKNFRTNINLACSGIYRSLRIRSRFDDMTRET